MASKTHKFGRFQYVPTQIQVETEIQTKKNVWSRKRRTPIVRAIKQSQSGSFIGSCDVFVAARSTTNFLQQRKPPPLGDSLEPKGSVGAKGDWKSDAAKASLEREDR
jgi:hypothetical protein